MKCVVEGCREPAICRYCAQHRPGDLPPDLERPSVGPDEDTVDLRPEWIASEETRESV